MSVPSTSSRWKRGPRILVALAFLAACGGSAAPSGTPTPTSPAGPPKSLPALKLAVLEAVGGRIDYCDPDEYPVPQGAPAESARARLPMIERDRAAFAAILEHEGLTAGQQLTDEQVIAISNDYKQIQAIVLRRSGDVYRFSVLVPKSGSRTGNQLVTGTVSLAGVVTIERRQAGEPLNCPICLAAGVRISTPTGDVPVEDLMVGMPIWTTDLRGRRVLGVVMEAGRSPVPATHRLVRLTLADGRSVLASPGHPTADGRPIGELKAGDRLDGSVVVDATLVPYVGGATHDILPSGPTGAYFADGVLLGSTLTSERLPAPSS